MTRLGLDAFAGLGRQQLEELYAPPRDAPDLVDALALDCFHTFEEAERALIVSELGAHALLTKVEDRARELGVEWTSDTPLESLDLADDLIRELAPLYAQREMARLSIERQHPEIRAFTLISMFGALDAFVETAVEQYLRAIAPTSSASSPTTRSLVRAIRLELRAAEAAGRVGTEQAKRASDCLKVLAGGPKGLGFSRIDSCLAMIGLGNRGREVPPALDDALREFGAIRNCIVHRRGRADGRLFEEAPSLDGRFEAGQVIRLLRADYRRYSAALRTMGHDFELRIAMSAGAAPADDLQEWQANVTMNM